AVDTDLINDQEPVWEPSLLAMAVVQSHGCWVYWPNREQARSHRKNAVPIKNQVGYQAASWRTLISGAPLTTLAERRYCAVGPRSNAFVRACRA
ncbi:hypothetical protein CFII68_06184, partial [Pseudomonas sp. CFII68]